MKIKPVNNYLTFNLIDDANPDIVSIDSAKKEYRWGKVLDVGPGFPDFNGKIQPSQLKQEDTVYVMAHGKEVVELPNSDPFYVASELDIMCKIDLENLTLKPLGNYIEIEKIETKEEDSLILMPDSKTVPPALGVVKSLGYGWTDATGNPIEHQVSVGSTVVFNPYNTLIVDLEPLGFNEKRYLIMHTDIYGELVSND
jgi:co-chaperonin GroES (HSP10)